MLELRKAKDRGHADFGWLDSRHTFSFGDYFDPAQVGFSDLLVINDDRVAPGMGFPTHPHRDMEIFSYVLEGALEHKDSMGTGSVIRRGDVQMMSAGRGIRHSEFNGSQNEPVHFLQIWIEPAKKGITPSYEQKTFTAADKRGKLRLVASPDASEGSITLHADARIYASVLGKGERVTHEVPAGRGAWVQLTRGAVKVNGEALSAGDGASTNDAGALTIEAGEESELLLFDLG